MRILFILYTKFEGGHPRSAVAFAGALKKRGHHIDFAIAPEKRNYSLIEELNCKLYHIEVNRLELPRRSSIKKLCSILYSGKYDIIHAFDPVSVWTAYCLGKRTGKPVVYSICGGKPGGTLLPIDGLHLFSLELKEYFLSIYNLPEDRLLVSAARINPCVPPIDENYVQNLKDSCVDLTKPILMNISRVNENYRFMIQYFIEVVEELALCGYQYQLVHIGIVQDQRVKKEIQKYAQDAEKKLGYRCYFHIEKDVHRALLYYPWATVVGGVGRSSLEAMSLGKPVFICGKDGFAGFVTPENINNIAYYNFSGRNVKQTLNNKDFNKKLLVNQLIHLLNNSNEMKQLGEFAKSSIKKEMDVNSGAEKIEKLYNNILSSKQKKIGGSAIEYYIRLLYVKLRKKFSKKA